MSGFGNCRLLVAAPVIVLLGGCAMAGVPELLPPAPLTSEEQVQVLPLLAAEDARLRNLDRVEIAVESGSPAVRARAALALGRLRLPEARAPLLRLLQDSDTSVAATASFALGQLGDSLAAPALAAVLHEAGADRWTVAAEAAYALGKLPGHAAEAALETVLRTQEPGALPAGEPIASSLLATWRHPRPDDVGFITRWTESADPELRWRAAYALVRRATPAAAPVMQRLASDPDPRVRAMALRGLAFPAADSAGIVAAALPLVLAGVADPDYSVRVNAVRTLGGYSSPESVQMLVALLTGEDRHLAFTAAESLGRIGAAATAASPALREVALDPVRPPALRQVAVEGLARVDRGVAREAAERLSSDDEWRVRVGAARALVTAGSATRQMEALRRDRDARVASATLQAMVEAAGDSLAPLREVLIESLAATDLGVRTAALNGLRLLADPATFPLLLDAYGRARSDVENDVRLAAIDAIAALERAGADPARAFFARFGRSDDYQVRLRAHDRLGRAAAAWGDPLPLEPRPVDYEALLERSQPPQPAPRVRIETDQGPIDLALHAREAPLTVENFLSLARSGWFDGQEWPRVVPNFVVQGGDPRGDTSGGPGYSIRDEFNRHRYGAGTLGMALSGPDTGGSQWFITHSPQPHLDGAYTIFGEVVAGQEVTERILPGDRILRIHVLP